MIVQPHVPWLLPIRVRIPDHDAAHLKTLGQLSEYVASQYKLQGQKLSDNHIWIAIRRITSDEFGVAENELHKDIRFVEDLMC